MTATSQIGQYRILREIGVGGMGMVFAGEHLLIQRRAAIKTLLPAFSKQPEIVDRFFNEARATSAISDPGIVQVFDFGYHVDGTAYIVMELLEGEGLADRLDRLGTLPIQSALRIARQIASSLAAAHAKGIVHRDLKPENIFLIRDREAQGGERTKILDFGICAILEASDAAAPAETMIGTPIYMSPEQCRGGGRGDPRSDIYGLGCVLFQMLTGQAPFERETISEVIQAHLTEQPPLASSLREEVPALIDELVQRCLAKAPEDRFPSMAELGAAIEYALAELSAPELPLIEPAFFDAPRSDDREAAVAASGTPVGLSVRSTPARLPARLATPPGLPARSTPARLAKPSTRAEPSALLHTVSAEPRGGALRRAALGLALLGGAILASLAARFTDGDDALARASMASPPAVIAPAGPAGPAGAASPPAARSDTMDTMDAMATVASPPRPAAAPRTVASQRTVTAPRNTAPAAEPAPSSPSRVAGREPIPPRPALAPPTRQVRAAPPPATAAPARSQVSTPAAATEDLYDMR